MTKTVLVVDDDALFQREVARVLQKEGYACECPKTSLEALRLGLRKSYALVITDLEMPVLDGLKLVARLRGGWANAKTPVLVLSASNLASSVRQAKTLGVEGYLVKPVFPDDLALMAVRLAGPVTAASPSAPGTGTIAVIADTSAASLRRMADTLEAEGFRVAATCHDGLTAVEAALRERPAVVVLDLVLPRLTGLQVIETLRRKGLCPAFVVASASSTRDGVLAAKEAGAAYYVLKPFDLVRLRGIAAELVSQHVATAP